MAFLHVFRLLTVSLRGLCFQLVDYQRDKGKLTIVANLVAVVVVQHQGIQHSGHPLLSICESTCHNSHKLSLVVNVPLLTSS